MNGTVSNLSRETSCKVDLPPDSSYRWFDLLRQRLQITIACDHSNELQSLNGRFFIFIESSVTDGYDYFLSDAASIVLSAGFPSGRKWRSY